MPIAAVARLFRRSPPSLEAAQAYALWAATYPPEAHNALMRAEQAVVAPMISAAAPSRALDVGTGTGRYVPVITAAGARFVVGVDLSMAMLAAHEQGTRRVCGDACRLPFRRGAFDLISSSLMVGDIERVDVWVRELARLLAPGGHAIYSDFHPSWALQGWQRTFRAVDGRAFRLPYHPHTIDEHLSAFDAHGFDVRAIREPRLPPEGGSRIDYRKRSTPVVVAFHAVKRTWRMPIACGGRARDEEVPCGRGPSR